MEKTSYIPDFAKKGLLATALATAACGGAPEVKPTRTVTECVAGIHAMTTAAAELQEKQRTVTPRRINTCRKFPDSVECELEKNSENDLINEFLEGPVKAAVKQCNISDKDAPEVKAAVDAFNEQNKAWKAEQEKIEALAQ